MSIKQYWDKAVSFSEYLKDAEEKLNNPKNQDEVDKKQYYELALQRMNRAIKTFKKSEEDVQALKNKNFKGKILKIIHIVILR